MTATRGQAKPVAPYRAFPMGMCSFCGGFIIKPDGTVNRRKKWHQAAAPGEPDCLQTYMLGDQGYFRAQVWKRDQGVCAECPPGTTPLPRYGYWAADHIVPLADGGTWEMTNAQTLCDRHHKAKTSREAAARAATRRADDSPAEQLRILDAA